VKKLRVGVVGAGVIGQVMHLHFLRELSDQYQIVSICDISRETATLCARAYGIANVHTDWRELVRDPLDAIFILTSGSHAPIAIEASRMGLHVFTEKPMCFSAAEGREMIDAAEKAGVTLMVGYPKRYDPAFTKFREALEGLSPQRFLRVTTTESPFQPYVGHYPLFPPPSDVESSLLSSLQRDSDERLSMALHTNDAFLLRQYQVVLLDTLVHEINTVRTVMGEPTSLDFVDLRPGLATVLLSFGETTAAIHWIDTPEMVRYSMEFSMHAANGRATLSFPSPYLRNAPTLIAVESGDAHNVDSWRREETTSYESGFKEELRVFYDAVTSGRAVPTNGVDGARDIAMCQSIIRCASEKIQIPDPTTI
jgi:predicted dehydrogenase